MQILIALWRLLDHRQRWRLIGLQVISVLMAASTMGGIAAILPFFALLADPRQIARNSMLRYLYRASGFAAERHFVIALGAAFAISIIAANLINLAGSLATYRFVYRVGNAFQVMLFEEYLLRDYAFHSRTSGATLASNVLYETSRVMGGILQSGLILVTHLLTALFIITSMMLLDPWVAAAALVGLGAAYTGLYFAARGRLQRNGLRQSQYYARGSAIVSESFAVIKEIILTRAQTHFVGQFAQCSKPVSEGIVNTLAIAQSPRYVLEITTACSLVAGALYLSGRTGQTGPWIAQLSFIGLAAYRLLPALQQIFSAVILIRGDLPAFERVGPDLQRARSRALGASVPRIDATWIGRPRRDIQLQSVCFRHAAHLPSVICDVSLRVPAGATLGIIGANGSGKTTLIDLLAGLLAPESGRVLVDGVLLDASNRAGWQSAIAYVPQQIVLLDATLAQNIALGVCDAKIDRERLKTAARLARLEECVEGLPHGYEEVLGERGRRLSGGQQQRLGIARALYRRASILILDESTSALDGATEEAIVDTLHSLGSECTVIVIAHRTSTLRHCDLIIELANGRILRRDPASGDTAAELTVTGRPLLQNQ